VIVIVVPEVVVTVQVVVIVVPGVVISPPLIGVLFSCYVSTIILPFASTLEPFTSYPQPFSSNVNGLVPATLLLSVSYA